jgi:hypothetical protein
MASPTLTKGDTFPPLRGAAKDEDGLMALAAADAVELVAVGPEVFGGAITVLDPPEDVGDPASPDGFNWRYDLEADDTQKAGGYVPWLKVTWDAAATPPAVEWVKGGDTINIQEAPE